MSVHEFKFLGPYIIFTQNNIGKAANKRLNFNRRAKQTFLCWFWLALQKHYNELNQMWFNSLKDWCLFAQNH